MSARRKEVYARAATQLRTHARAYAAEKACPGAMGLYLFCLLQARGEETWGELPEEVVLSAWGASRTFRKRQADALIACGLLERGDGTYRIARYAEHNDTPDVIEANRSKERTKKQSQRRDVVVPIFDQGPPSGLVPRGQGGGQPGGVPRVPPISPSISPSGSDLEGGAGGPPPAAPSLDDPMPEWARRGVDAVAMSSGETLCDGLIWAKYVARRALEKRPISELDFRQWVCDEAKYAKRDRMAKPPRSVRPQDLVQPEIPGSWDTTAMDAMP